MNPELKTKQVPVGLHANLCVLVFWLGLEAPLTQSNQSHFLRWTFRMHWVQICVRGQFSILNKTDQDCLSLLEMQSTIVEIVENVKLTPPPGMEDIVMMRVPVGAIMAPMVKGKFDERTQMPLGVEFLH
jgi:hypothetical protein